MQPTRSAIPGFVGKASLTVSLLTAGLTPGKGLGSWYRRVIRLRRNQAQQKRLVNSEQAYSPAMRRARALLPQAPANFAAQLAFSSILAGTRCRPCSCEHKGSTTRA